MSGELSSVIYLLALDCSRRHRVESSAGDRSAECDVPARCEPLLTLAGVPNAATTGVHVGKSSAGVAASACMKPFTACPSPGSLVSERIDGDRHGKDQHRVGRVASAKRHGQPPSSCVGTGVSRLWRDAR